MSEILIESITAKEFGKVAKEAHLACFNEERPDDFNRYDYALVCHSEKEGLMAYATILEHDAESAYMQHGGALPHVQKNLSTVKCYLLMLRWLKKKYPVVTTRIFNDNIPMLKLAFTGGFKIHGVEYYKQSSNFKGGILLCLSIESELCPTN